MELRAPQALTSTCGREQQATERDRNWYILRAWEGTHRAVNHQCTQFIPSPPPSTQRSLWVTAAKKAVTFQSSHMQINQHLCWLQKSQHSWSYSPRHTRPPAAIYSAAETRASCPHSSPLGTSGLLIAWPRLKTNVICSKHRAKLYLGPPGLWMHYWLQLRTQGFLKSYKLE